MIPIYGGVHMGWPTWKEIGVGAVGYGVAKYAFDVVRQQTFATRLIAGVSCTLIGGTLLYKSSIITSLRQWMRGGRAAMDSCDAPLTRSRVYTVLSGAGLLAVGAATCAYIYFDTAAQYAQAGQMQFRILDELQKCKAARLLMQKAGVGKSISIEYDPNDAAASYDVLSNTLTLPAGLDAEGQLAHSLKAFCKHGLTEKINAVITETEEGAISSFEEFIKKILTPGWEVTACQRQAAISCLNERGWPETCALPYGAPSFEAFVARILKDKNDPTYIATKSQWDALTNSLFCEQNPQNPSCISTIMQTMTPNATS